MSVFRSGNFVALGKCRVNLDQVRKFEYVDDDDERVRVVWANGDEEILWAHDIIETQRYHIIPALPGFELLSYWPDTEDAIALDRAVVIAWRINEDQTVKRYVDETVIAISLGGTSADQSSNTRVGVRHPDGKVTIHQDCRQFESEAEWQEWAKADWARAEEEERKRRAVLKVVGEEAAQ